MAARGAYNYPVGAAPLLLPSPRLYNLQMAPIGRILILAGVVLIVLGVILGYTGFFSLLKLGRLPGDISIKRENFSFYFPITTCIVISIVLSLVFYLLRK